MKAIGIFLLGMLLGVLANQTAWAIRFKSSPFTWDYLNTNAIYLKTDTSKTPIKFKLDRSLDTITQSLRSIYTNKDTLIIIEDIKIQHLSFDYFVNGEIVTIYCAYWENGEIIVSGYEACNKKDFKKVKSKFSKKIIKQAKEYINFINENK